MIDLILYFLLGLFVGIVFGVIKRRKDKRRQLIDKWFSNWIKTFKSKEWW